VIRMSRDSIDNAMGGSIHGVYLRHGGRTYGSRMRSNLHLAIDSLTDSLTAPHSRFAPLFLGTFHGTIGHLVLSSNLRHRIHA
jgi:hypothetical protein